MKKLFLMILGICLLSTALFGGYIYKEMQKKYSGPEIIFTVENGDTFGKVNQRLYNLGVISNKRLFHYYAKYKKELTQFKAGSFSIPTGATITSILFTLVHGTPILTTITIPEGKNMYEIAEILGNSGICTKEKFLEMTHDPEILTLLNLNAENIEGYLFPETYLFAPNTPAKTVVKTMLKQFQDQTATIDFTHPFLSKHQVVILASMVEKETGAKEERPAIAGVFTNRLKKRMRLESDPTTIYGIWHRYRGNIKKSDLLEITPYNTYKIPSLPKGPIANPSLEAIKAVLNPESHEYFFFVSKNDGTHVFTRNYKDHTDAVDSFQKKSSARKGKSWRDLKQ